MIVAKIQVNGAIAHTLYRKVIPAGIIGAQVEFEYAEDIWKGLHKTVVFRGTVTKDVVTDANIVTMPPEVAENPMSLLSVGVYGVDADGNLAIPTIWADLGVVRESANPSGDTTTDPSLPVWAQIQAMIGNLDDLDTNAKNNLVAAVNEALTKGGGEVDPAEIQRIVEDYLAANPPSVTEIDPTVPAWAKQPNKPTYTAEEVHAMPDTYTPPDQTAQQVGADPAGTAATAVSQHNTDTAAHNDLRVAMKDLADRVNAALDSDDTTLDQMSEVVAYIKSNKSLIDAITTSKVSVADIVNDLVTNVADKPLSAAQGVALKKLIDDLQAMIPETYTLPIATETALGGVKPVTATEAMTQPVGVDAEGRLMTKPGSGGSGIAVSGATVGQTVKIAAVDDNGVPTAWEPVDFPSGGGTGARTICVPTELESGIIPSGEAAWTSYKINTTLADIQEWDEFLVEWYGMTTNSYWSFKPTGTDIQDASWILSSSKTVYLYEWVDSDHTHVRVKSISRGVGGVINGIESNKGAIKSDYAYSVLCIADWSGIDPTTKMVLVHNVETNADITYKVWGIVKKEA